MKNRFTIVMGFMVLMGGPMWSSASNTPLIIVMDMHPPFYIPTHAIAELGQAIQWYNRSDMPHTITHDGCIRGGNCAFDSGILHPEGRFAPPSLHPGQYPYHCNIHPFMRGILTVKKASPPSSIFSTDL